MHDFVGERVLMRVFVGEGDKHEGRPVYRAIVALLRERGCAGATVLRSIMGFGARRVVHSAMNEITSADLPLVVECVETEARVEAILPDVDAIVRGGVITLERANVILYRSASATPADARPEARPAAVAHTEARMHGFEGERTLMRIHVGEDDRHGGVPLYQAIVDLLRRRHLAGATVFRGVLGFGAQARLHEDRGAFRLSSDLPIVIECVDTEEKIAEVLPELDAMIGGGLVTLERARVILYRPEVAKGG